MLHAISVAYPTPPIASTRGPPHWEQDADLRAVALIAMIEPLSAYELDQRVSAIHYEPSSRSMPLDRHRRTRARAPDADLRVPTNPPGLELPLRRFHIPQSPRNRS